MENILVNTPAVVTTTTGTTTVAPAITTTVTAFIKEPPVPKKTEPTPQSEAQPEEKKSNSFEEAISLMDENFESTLIPLLQTLTENKQALVKKAITEGDITSDEIVLAIQQASNNFQPEHGINGALILAKAAELQVPVPIASAALEIAPLNEISNPDINLDTYALLIQYLADPNILRENEGTLEKPITQTVNLSMDSIATAILNGIEIAELREELEENSMPIPIENFIRLLETKKWHDVNDLVEQMRILAYEKTPREMFEWINKKLNLTDSPERLHAELLPSKKVIRIRGTINRNYR